MSAGISGSYTVLSAATMSSVNRASSASGSDDALFSTSTSSRLWIGSSVMAPPSSEYLLRLGERTRQAVDLVPGVIEPERRPACRRHAVAREQRHYAMGAGTNRNAGAVDDGGDVVRMRALHLERHDWTLVLRRAENPDRIDLAQPLVGVGRNGGLVGANARLADRIDVVDGGAETDRLDDRRRAGLEAVRRLAIGDAVLEHVADHLASAVKRRHRGEQIV